MYWNIRTLLYTIFHLKTARSDLACIWYCMAFRCQPTLCAMSISTVLCFTTWHFIYRCRIGKLPYKTRFYSKSLPVSQRLSRPANESNLIIAEWMVTLRAAIEGHCLSLRPSLCFSRSFRIIFASFNNIFAPFRRRLTAVLLLVQQIGSRYLNWAAGLQPFISSMPGEVNSSPPDELYSLCICFTSGTPGFVWR